MSSFFKSLLKIQFILSESGLYLPGIDFQVFFHITTAFIFAKS